MHKVFTVALHEFIETVRTKMFFVSAVIVPVLIMAFTFGAQLIATRMDQQALAPRAIGLVDETGQLAGPIRAWVVDDYNRYSPSRPLKLEVLPVPADLPGLAARVQRGELYAYLRIPAAAIRGEAKCEFGRRDQSMELAQALDKLLHDLIFAARCRQIDPFLDPQKLVDMQQQTELLFVDVRTGLVERQSQQVFRMLMPFAFMLLLFMGTMQISFGLLTGVIEEKSSRVMEVLLSAISPLQLISGKILGMVGVGVVLLMVWGGVGYLAAAQGGYGSVVGGPALWWAALYFVPGFLLFSSILGAIGSACNTLKEAQSMSSPISILNIVPLVMWFPITQNPNSLLAVLLGYFPPLTPFIMVLRIAADPQTPLWQILTTLAILWASVFAAMWAAAKIFRVGVLMYGKPPTLRELSRWVRYA